MSSNNKFKQKNTPSANVDSMLSFKISEMISVAGVIPDALLPQFMRLMVILAKGVDSDAEMQLDKSTWTLSTVLTNMDYYGDVCVLATTKLEGSNELHIQLAPVPATGTQSSPAPVATPAPVTPVEEVSDLSYILRLMESNKVEVKESYSQLSKVISENDSHYRSRLTGVENSLADIRKAIGNPTANTSPDESSEGWGTKEYCIAGAGVAALGGVIYFMTR